MVCVQSFLKRNLKRIRMKLVKSALTCILFTILIYSDPVQSLCYGQCLSESPASCANFCVFVLALPYCEPNGDCCCKCKLYCCDYSFKISDSLMIMLTFQGLSIEPGRELEDSCWSVRLSFRLPPPQFIKFSLNC